MVLALVLLSLVVHTMPGFASVTGVVTDAKGVPVVGATVTLTDEANPINTFSNSTDNQGKYSITLSVGIDASTPFAFSLGQNYPNPFNPTTTIPFTLDSSGHVSMSIYNIMGQRVTTVVDTYMNAGSHIVTWDGMDNRGNHAGAGIYLYQLRAGSSTVTKKMLLLDGGGSPAAAKLTMNSGTQSVAKRAAESTYTLTVICSGNIIYTYSGIKVAGEQQLNISVSLTSGIIVIKNIPFRKVLSGTYQMGGSDVVAGHTVTISAFTMSIYEITQGQYYSLVGTNPSFFKGDDNLPVEKVSWFDAGRFCNKLSDLAGLERCYTNEYTGACDFTKNGFRLPTEAEWEYACRAGTTTAYSYGDNQNDLGYAGWYTSNSSFKTHPVGQKIPNPWGFYDMYGNVSEWCYDWYGPYTDASAIDPIGPADYYATRIERGGRYETSAGSCMSKTRFKRDPGEKSDEIGFRIVSRP